MYRWKTDKNTYLRLKECLNELHPEIEIELLSCDENLENLRFAQSAPCTVNLYLTKEQRRILLDELEMIEMEAIDFKDRKSNERYEKYGWLWAVFYNLEEYEENWARGTLKEVPFWRDDMSVEEYEIERTYFHEHWDDWTKGKYVPLWKQKRDVDPKKVRNFVFEIVKKEIHLVPFVIMLMKV